MDWGKVILFFYGVENITLTDAEIQAVEKLALKYGTINNIESIDSSVLQMYSWILREQIGVSNVVEVLAVIALAIVGLVFMWWGVRKITSALMKSFKKGKISL